MKVTRAQLIQVIKEELIKEQEPLGDMFDLLKGERPPPHSAGQYSLRDPDANTEASMTPNHEVELERVIHDMKDSGKTVEEITQMVAEAVSFAFS